nr:MAG TPA: hypothetical protein [Herelleviridae sp.]
MLLRQVFRSLYTGKQNRVSLSAHPFFLRISNCS